jgi:hypothetical protein
MVEGLEDGGFSFKQFQVIPTKISPKKQQFDDDSVKTGSNIDRQKSGQLVGSFLMKS